MENSGKICWNLWKVEKSGKKCEKNFGKSLKKIWKILDKFFTEQYFLLRKKWKILENLLKIVESGKIW